VSKHCLYTHHWGDQGGKPTFSAHRHFVHFRATTEHLFAQLPTERLSGTLQGRLVTLGAPLGKASLSATTNLPPSSPLFNGVVQIENVSRGRPPSLNVRSSTLMPVGILAGPLFLPIIYQAGFSSPWALALRVGLHPHKGGSSRKKRDTSYLNKLTSVMRSDAERSGRQGHSGSPPTRWPSPDGATTGRDEASRDVSPSKHGGRAARFRPPKARSTRT